MRLIAVALLTLVPLSAYAAGLVVLETHGTCTSATPCAGTAVTMIPPSGRAMFNIPLASETVMSFVGDTFASGDDRYTLRLSEVRFEKDGAPLSSVEVTGQCVADTPNARGWHRLECVARDGAGKAYGVVFTADGR